MGHIVDTPFTSAARSQRAFTLNRNGTIPDGSVTATYIMYLLEPNSDTIIGIYDEFVSAFAGDVKFEMYVNPTIGTPFDALDPAVDLLKNKYLGSTRPQKFSLTTTTDNTRVTAFGTKIEEGVVTESTTGAEGKFYSAEIGDDHPDILAPPNTLLLVMKNTGVATSMHLHFEFAQDEAVL